MERFHEAVPVMCQLLRSKTSTDVLEAINFFTAAWEFRLSFAVKGDRLQLGCSFIRLTRRRVTAGLVELEI